jgi:hypothetical protein
MSGEHYLPRELGTFEGFRPLLARTCDRCNNKIGNETETQFLRTGPIAFFRWMIGVNGRDGPPPSPFYRWAGGAPPIYVSGRVPEFPWDLLWETHRGTENCFPLRQLVVEHSIGGFAPIPILDSDKGNPESVRRRIREMGFENSRPVQASATPEERERVTDIVAALGGSCPELSTTEFQPRRVELSAAIAVTSAFFRAVAKIGFHYALKMLPDLTGHEPEFAAVRDFIRAGGDSRSFVRQRDDHVFVNFQSGLRPVDWSHILCVERSYLGIVAFAQFFVGPRSLPPVYEIRLGLNPARIIVPVERKAHIFLYPSDEAGIGPNGIMDYLCPSTIVSLPG